MMTTLLHRLAETIEREGLIPNEQDIFIALSGGADSVALLRAMLLLGYSPQALHCNFNLRASESDGDEQFVRQLCEEHQVPLHCQSFPTETYAQQQGISIEMAARELRYQWFQTIKAQHERASLIAVAHNADDMVETLLLNLSMGTGIRGLSGMPYKREDGIIRPLMDCSRKEILDFLKGLGQAHREDSSNASMDYKRNYIRHKLIPSFEVLNPRFKANSLTTIRHLRETEELYLNQVERLKQELLTDKGIKLKALRQAPCRQTLLFELLSPYNFSPEQVSELSRSLDKLRQGANFFSATHQLLISKDYIEILERHRQKWKALSIDIATNGAIELPIGLLSWELLKKSDLKSLLCPKEVALFDLNNLRESLEGESLLTIRTRQEGDKLQPFGMKGMKKLRRIFIDNKFTHKEREEALILSSPSGQVLWLIKHLSDAQHRVTNKTTKLIRFELKPQ